MRIHRYLLSSAVNGPGKRFVLWVQGCSRNCAGCFNPETHDRDKGSVMTADEILNLVPLRETEGITVSGGEPFEQPEELAVLLKLAALRNLHRLVYTGFRYEELKAMKDRNIDECLALTDMLVDGEYAGTIPQNHSWAGSGNQRVLVLDEGKIVKEIEALEAVSRNGELIIDRDGNITATGFVDSRIIP